MDQDCLEATALIEPAYYSGVRSEGSRVKHVDEKRYIVGIAIAFLFSTTPLAPTKSAPKL
jgi:hypothetical protein